MNLLNVLTVVVEPSGLSDGMKVYTASLEEMPGVVAEGSSEEAAVLELIALVKDLQERLGSPVVGVRTKAVAAWSWTMHSGQDTALSYGSGQLEDPTHASIPEGYRESKALS